MNYKSNLLNKLLLAIFAMAVFTLTSCDDDEDPSFSEPTITVTPATVSGLPGAAITMSIAATADAGLKAIKVDGVEAKTYSTATTADAFTYDFTIPATAAVGSSIT